jgi:hypothetical protein
MIAAATGCFSHWPGGAAAAGPARLAMHWQRVTRAAPSAPGHGSRSAASARPGCPPGPGQTVPGQGLAAAAAPRRPSGGHLSGPGSGYPGRPGVRVTQKVDNLKAALRP